MNAAGQVVWRGYDGRWDVFISDRATRTNVSGGTGAGLPRINANGQVTYSAWDGHDSEIMFWSNGVRTQVSDSSLIDQYPQINDSGHLAWDAEGDVMYWDGTSITTLSVGAETDSSPDINSGGQVAWRYEGDAGGEIYLWDGTDITQISNYPSRVDHSPVIADNGDIAWQSNSWAPNGNQVYLWHNLNVTPLTTTGGFGAVINADGWVAWEGGDGGIYVWDGTSVRLVSPDAHSDCDDPQINDDGQVVWSGHDGHDAEIYLWDAGGRVYQLTDNDYSDVTPDISGSWITWASTGGTGADMHVYCTQTPEPGTFLLFGLGLGSAVLMRRRRRAV